MGLEPTLLSTYRHQVCVVGVGGRVSEDASLCAVAAGRLLRQVVCASTEEEEWREEGLRWLRGVWVSSVTYVLHVTSTAKLTVLSIVRLHVQAHTFACIYGIESALLCGLYILQKGTFAIVPTNVCAMELYLNVCIQRELGTRGCSVRVSFLFESGPLR